MFSIPFTNACTLIALSYIALKLKNRLFMERYETISASLLTGLASIILMLPPIPDSMLLTDLRFAPIIMAGLRFGWRVALLSTILPSLYILEFGEAYAIANITQNILLPAVTSSLFYRKENTNFYTMIPFMDGVKICVMLAIVRLALSGYLEQKASFNWFMANTLMLILTILAVFVLIVMYNEDNRTWVLQRRLELQANQDGLTGLPNLRSFMNMARNTARYRPITIMMIDIDNFKRYNDSFGHLQGDLLLRGVGQVLGNMIGEQDYLARYGGEEFIVMSHTTDAIRLAEYAQKLCDAVASHSYQEAVSSSITISIGISISRCRNDELLRMISEADEALYISKDSGKNRYTFYKDPTVEEAAVVPSASIL